MKRFQYLEILFFIEIGNVSKKGGIIVESSPEVVKQKGNSKEKSSKWEYVKKHRLLYLMLAPGLLLTLVFNLNYSYS